MGLGNPRSAATFITFLSFLCSHFGAAIDTITSSQPIKDPENIVSLGNVFKLGFFSPINSTNRYVGIWYSNFSGIKPVWVANRNRPVNDSSGMVTISDDGNLVILNGQKEIIWSSNVSNGVSNSTAQITDDGNLLLIGSPNGSLLWQSFDQPSDTYLAKMKLTANRRTDEKTVLTSWISPSDPSIGKFSAGVNPLFIPELFVWNNSRPLWRSGPWVGQFFIGIPGMAKTVYLNGGNLRDEGNGVFTLSSTSADKNLLINYALSWDGKFTKGHWYPGMEGWIYDWQVPSTECDVYGKCGPFGSCNKNNSPICSCLRGFEPRNADEWNKGNWSGGCARRTSLQSDRAQNGTEMGRRDGFLKLEKMKVPNFAEFWISPSSEQECNTECLNNSSCVAYSYYNGFGCMSWTRNLMDMQKFSDGGTDLYIRLAYSELDKKRNMKVIAGVSVVIGAIIISTFVFFTWRWIAGRGGNKHEAKPKRKQINEVNLFPKSKEDRTFSDENVLEDNVELVRLKELAVFNLQKLAAATDNFDISSKLGQGGFGPVFRGKLPDGQEIAVKRLSRASGQGLQEFMNEVEVISKLQHRNLVRLLGCCVEGEEKMLVYEYMPNKSLDAFLFDPEKRELLDWKMRFKIVDGICRGLLYLHRDSRLKIIHRDLKPSNILLDQELNPKISDFGMARIFGSSEDQANTTRVVGTHGYMSLEYVMEGLFSEKSDVYSFGVLLLEIVTGRRNTSFYGDEKALSLIGFAWKSWIEGNIAALVDPAISDPRFLEEIFRCIHVGLLCVQEFAKDRPAVSTIISMLNSEITYLPNPKKPAFAERQNQLDEGSIIKSQKRDSINNVTVSDLKGR